MLVNIFALKPDKIITKAFKLFSSSLILLNLRSVDISVHFNDQAASGAIEVCDKGTNGNLPPKLETSELPIAQLFPKDFFSARHFLLQFSGLLLNDL